MLSDYFIYNFYHAFKFFFVQFSSQGPQNTIQTRSSNDYVTIVFHALLAPHFEYNVGKGDRVIVCGSFPFKGFSSEQLQMRPIRYAIFQQQTDFMPPSQPFPLSLLPKMFWYSPTQNNESFWPSSNNLFWLIEVERSLAKSKADLEIYRHTKKSLPLLLKLHLMSSGNLMLVSDNKALLIIITTNMATASLYFNCKLIANQQF